MDVCAYLWLYVCTYVCMHAFVCMHVCIYVCMHACISARRAQWSARTCVLHTAALLLWMRCAIIWSKLGARRCKRTWRLLRSRAHAAACTSPLSHPNLKYKWCAHREIDHRCSLRSGPAGWRLSVGRLPVVKPFPAARPSPAPCDQTVFNHLFFKKKK